MFWTLKGIRLSKPSRRASASRRGSAMGWAVIRGSILAYSERGEKGAGWKWSTPLGNSFQQRGRGHPRYTVLHQALVQHRISDFQKARDVRAVHQVAGRAVFRGRFVAVAVDGSHDFMQLVIHFL